MEARVDRDSAAFKTAIIPSSLNLKYPVEAFNQVA